MVYQYMQDSVMVQLECLMQTARGFYAGLHSIIVWKFRVKFCQNLVIYHIVSSESSLESNVTSETLIYLPTPNLNQI